VSIRVEHQHAAEKAPRLTLIARCVYSIASSTYNPCKSTDPIGCDLLFSGGLDASTHQRKSSTIFPRADKPKKASNCKPTVKDPLCGLCVQLVAIPLMRLALHGEVVRFLAVAGGISLLRRCECLAL
jgi:hypothetical protein